MTKVMGPIRGTALAGAWLCGTFLLVHAYSHSLAETTAAPVPPELHSAAELYAKLSTVGLAHDRIYQVREASLDRASLHITLEDGTIAFTEDVAGRVTGAFFEGEGDVLLLPPNKVERASMALFTGAAILEEKFGTAYFRFNDDTFRELRPWLHPANESTQFVDQWGQTASNLAGSDPLRLLMTFSESLPSLGTVGPSQPEAGQAMEDRFLHARMQGRKLGGFDIYYDSTAPEQIWAGQLRTYEGEQFYDVWTSFTAGQSGGRADGLNGIATESGAADALYVSNYKIHADVTPPLLNADAVLQVEVRRGRQRTALFELSRFLEVKQVDVDGHPVEFIHNQSLEGTQRARRRDDVVAVVFPAPLRTGQKLTIHFVYDGEVLSEVGKGLLYVGERGTWYPNRGLVMSNFDLEFHYPSEWTLVATGKSVSVHDNEQGTEKTSRWVSDRPMPLAGFNLGKYSRTVAHADDVIVETYATPTVEKTFPRPPQPETVLVLPRNPYRTPLRVTGIPAPASSPSPANNAQAVADASAKAVDFLSRRFGPYPYGGLKLTQMPGKASQGWPGLIFLSSYSFLTDEEQSRLPLDTLERTLSKNVVVHETAHQWWGDLVGWSSYRDQWIGEALANYSALMMLQSDNPEQFRAVMEKYRDDLLQKQKRGSLLMEAGPVTLGSRLSSSQFPGGYTAISYGRGTWLLHMLRNMLVDAQQKVGQQPTGKQGASDPFIRTLRRVRDRYQEKPITTRELLQAFEEDLPPSLWYEGRKSLDWFYDSWINGTTVPKLELHGVKYADVSGSTTVTGILVQEDVSPELVTSVPIYALLAKKPVLLGRVFAEGPATQFRLRAPTGTRRVIADPNQTVLSRPR